MPLPARKSRLVDDYEEEEDAVPLMQADDDLDDIDDIGKAMGTGEVQEDFMSNLSRIAQLTGKPWLPSLPGHL